MEVLKGVFGMGAKFLLPKNVKTFSCVGRRFNIPKKKNHPKILPSPPMGIQHSYRKRIFTIIKRLKYPYHPLKPPAADHCPPLLPPSAATSIKDIFGNLSIIPGNSIYTSNTPKISYLRKLFPEIKIYFIYQTPPKCDVIFLCGTVNKWHGLLLDLLELSQFKKP